MEKRRKITQYRERLDKTPASPDLKNEERLKTLVKDQLLLSSKMKPKKLIDKRTAEVSYFLDMLRSVSVNDTEGLKASEKSHAEWKLKQDNEEFRVMYREGPQGTTFHTLLVEGFVDGLLIFISDSEDIDITTHGFTSEAIPEADDVVRIDVVGGFALQKVTPERSYFRTIANMDIKLDFFPPSLINFISRQLIGNGFRLYQKAVSSMFKSDEDFSKALGDPLYTKIREALYSTNVSKRSVEGKELKSDACILPEEHLIGSTQDDILLEVNITYHVSESEPKNARVTDSKAFGEIEEEESEESRHFEEDSKDIDQISTKEFIESCLRLEKVISMVREYGFNAQTRFSSGVTSEEPPIMEKGLLKDSNSSEVERVCSNGEVIVEVSNKEIIERTSQEQPRNSSSNHSFRRAGSNSHSREVNHNKVAPASPEQYGSVPSEAKPGCFVFPGTGM
ncbi:iron-sulfur cluster co-chaperone protein hscb, mitochondrial [Fagus crenata]